MRSSEAATWSPARRERPGFPVQRGVPVAAARVAPWMTRDRDPFEASRRALNGVTFGAMSLFLAGSSAAETINIHCVYEIFFRKSWSISFFSSPFFYSYVQRGFHV
jgi:hypothetical protein